MFYLDPSPFRYGNELTVYHADACQPPTHGELITANVYASGEPFYDGTTFNNVIKKEVKRIDGWKILDPDNIHEPEFTLSTEEFLLDLSAPFKGTEEHIEALIHTIAMFAVSTPYEGSNHKGGIYSAVLTTTTKNVAWNALKQTLSFIPVEFTKPTSYNFYSLTEKDQMINPTQGGEINIACRNPKLMTVHMPMTISNDIEKKDFYKDKLEIDLPMMRAFLVNAIMIQPEVPESLESKIREKIYEMANDFKGAGFATYNQDLGASVLKIATAGSRLNHKLKTDSDDLKLSIDNWGVMAHFSRRIHSKNTGIEISKMYRLSDNARILYLELKDRYGIEELILTKEIELDCPIPLSYLDDALTELSKNAMIYYPPGKYGIKLLDFVK
jgi:hypothetical protein